MTRKRFVKLLMADGYQRNKANETADAVVNLKISYEEAFHKHTAPEIIKAIEKAAAEIGEAVCEVVIGTVHSIGEFFMDFGTYLKNF